MTKRLSLAVLTTLACLSAAPAFAQSQVCSPSLPPQTLVGNPGPVTGPCRAVSFSTLQAAIVAGGETTVNDTNYTVVSTDSTIVYTALTAARTVTMLAASAYSPGTRLKLFDRSGSSNAARTLSFVPNGADLINGANSTYVAVSSPYTEATAETDGISKWTVTSSFSTAISPTLTGNWTFAPTTGDAITINTANVSKGFNIAQNGPTIGSTASDFHYNLISPTDGVNVTGGNLSTSALTATLLVNNSNAKGQKRSVWGLTNQSGTSMNTSGDAIGVSGWAISNTTNGGTNTGAGAKGTLFGGEFVGTAFSGATNYFEVAGAEFAAVINAGATAKHRWGVSSVFNSTVSGVTSDAAYEIGATVSPGHGTGILLNNFHGGQPIATTGCVICSDGSAATITKVIDLSTYTISGNIFTFANYSVTGAGAITAASLTAPLHAGGTGAASTLTLESTSGAGTTDAIILKTASQVERARITTGGLVNIGPSVTPDSLLTVMANNAATVTPPTSGTLATLVHIVGADTVIPAITLDSFASASQVLSRRADGTLASKSAVASGVALFSFGPQGWDSSTYGAGSAMQFATSEAWGASAHGSNIKFFSIANTTTTLTENMRLHGSGGLAVGNANVATDPLAGIVLASGLQTKVLTVATLPTCNAAAEGQRAYVSDQNTAVAYRGATTGGGATRQAVLCSNSAWIQD